MKKIFLSLLPILFVLASCNNHSSEVSSASSLSSSSENIAGTHLINKMNELNEEFNKNTQFKLKTAIEFNSTTTSQSTLLQTEPLYIENEIDNMISVTQVENNKIFTYSFQHNKDVLRKYIGEYNANSNIENSDIDDVFELEDLINNFDCTEQDNVYTISGTYGEYLSLNDVFDIESFKDAYGEIIEDLLETELKISFEFENKKIKLTLEMPLKFPNNQTYNLKVRLEMLIWKFLPIDFYNGNYKLSSPECMEEVYQISNLSDIYCSHYGTNIFKVELKKGLLIMETEENNVALKDENLKYISNSNWNIILDDMKYSPLEDMIEIQKDGIYYLYINATTEGKKTFKNVEYTSLCESINLNLPSGTHEFELEGKYDIFKLVDDSNNQHVKIKITNSGNNKFALYVRNTLEVFELNPEDSIEVTLLSQFVDDLYIFSDFDNTTVNQIKSYKITYEYIN